MQTLPNWQKKAQAGKLKGTDNYDPKLIAALEEIKQLKRQLKIVEEEREILKKATAYFIRRSVRKGLADLFSDARPRAMVEAASQVK